MTTRRVSVLACALVLALAGAAQALTLTTRVVFALGTNPIECNIVNLSGVARTITIEILNPEGDVVMEGTGEVAAHGVSGLILPAPNTYGYCRFTVPGVKSTWRAGACVVQLGVGHASCVPAE